MKYQIENLKDTIAKEYGFNSWDQYFDYFITTKPGRRILRNAIRKVLWEVLLLSDDLLSSPKYILKNYESKDLDSTVREKWYDLHQELHEINRKKKRTSFLSFTPLTMEECNQCPSIKIKIKKDRKQRNRVQNQVPLPNTLR